MPSDLLRDSTFGQIVNFLSKGNIFLYPEQEAGYVVPVKYLTHLSPPSESSTQTFGTGAADLVNASPKETSQYAPREYLVEWEENDPDNPQNWSDHKRYWVASMIMLLAFSIYIGSAIYTSSIPGVVEDFGVSQTMATLGLGIFVLGYGCGPMLLSPIQEMPFVGRNPPYMIGLFLFVIFQIPIIIGPNFNTILAFRFLGAFSASAALATGAASMGDIFPPSKVPYAISAWAMAALCGPVAGPVIGGFAAMADGWRWPMYELLWITGLAFIVLFFGFPETLGSTILVRRAERLRKLTGNPLIRTRSEMNAQVGATFLGEAAENCINAVKLMSEPSILFANIYIALVYAIFYLWFEAFPLVFEGIYHFNLGEEALPFLGFLVTAVFTLTFYFWYNRYVMEPRYAKDPDLPPEIRLELGIGAGCIIPVSLFLFGWSARLSVHWIVPVIGAALYLPGLFLVFQSVLIYITMGFPKQAASILAGNNLLRSATASVFPLFGAHFFRVLGIGGGCSLLAGLSIIMVFVMYLLKVYGARLRARSKWTDAVLPQ